MTTGQMKEKYSASLPVTLKQRRLALQTGKARRCWAGGRTDRTDSWTSRRTDRQTSTPSLEYEWSHSLLQTLVTMESPKKKKGQ